MARRGRGGLREGRNAEPVASSLYTTPAVAPSPRVLAVNTPDINFGNFQITPEMLANIQAGIPQPAPAPTVDPSLYSDPGLGAPIPLNVGIGGEGGGQPMPQVPMPAPKPIPQPAPAPYADPAPVPQPRPQPIPQPVPQPIPAPAPPPPPPPPVEVAPPPPPIPQISPEVLAQIQQEFNIPVAPPVQVPPPVVQPEGIATLPQAPVEPPAPPVQVPPPVDPSLYSDPGLGVSPMSPREQMGSNYIAPRDGPGQMPPRFTSGEDFMSDYNPMASGESMGNPTNLGTGIPTGGDPTGIETMAESVGQGDYLGIPLPDGGKFDLNTLDLSSIGGEGGMGNVDPSLYSDPGLGGGPDTRGVGPGFDPFAGVTGGLGPGGYGPEGGGELPTMSPMMGGINIPIDLSGIDLSGIDLSGIDLSGIGGEGGGEPPMSVGGPQDGPGGFDLGIGGEGGSGGGPGMGNGPGFTFNDPNPAESGGTTPDTSNGLTPAQQAALDAFNEQYPNGFDPGIGGEGGAGGGSGPGVPGGGGPGNGNGPGGPGFGDNAGNADEEGSGNPYPFIPPGTDTSGMTAEMLAGLNSFYEQYPDGFDIGNINPGIGAGGGGNPGGTGTDDGSYTVDPVDPVGNLGTGDDAGSDPIDVTTPYVPPETRAASSYGLTGAVQTMPVAANPFRRPEAQQGIGSLAGGG